MKMFTVNLANLLLLSATVYAVAFDGPLPTPVVNLDVITNGWTPKPTEEPRSLPDIFRRQKNDKLCGYIEGDGEFAVSCSTGMCSSNTALNWFGCCTGTASDSCNIATRCVASASVEACLSDSSCYDDPYLTACTIASAPFCVQMNSVVSENTFSHFVCAPTSTVVQVLASSTGAGESGSIIQTAIASGKDGKDLRATATRSATDGAGADQNTVVTTSRSTGAAVMQTAGAFVGSFLGVVAILF
ncbi:hypothetical protein BKA66DRAFT_442869 [Pyrenochaeta sp. MPI-SDFR-AT-0127]|nr:hypothetical protein BKA66DRAFT_442869 [Pyrenochaeta sp. MPI-SDFR-AT-0127]